MGAEQFIAHGAEILDGNEVADESENFFLPKVQTLLHCRCVQQVIFGLGGPDVN